MSYEPRRSHALECESFLLHAVRILCDNPLAYWHYVRLINQPARVAGPTC